MICGTIHDLFLCWRNSQTRIFLRIAKFSSHRCLTTYDEKSSGRLGAIMFTDIVGYTSLVQKDELGTMKVLQEHRDLLRTIFAKQRGLEVKTIGDAFLVEFDSALNAVACAVEIQKSISARNAVSSKKLQLRIGIHLGEIIHEDHDVYGDAVNIASRIEPLAEPGGICISGQVYDVIRNKLDVQVVRLGPMDLKNVKIPTEIYRVRVQETPAERKLAGTEKYRVAVLPFANFSSEPDDDYFADGLTEELIATMAKIRELSIISRTSVMQYKDKPKPMSEIGRELNAGTILEGSVRKSGNRLRVSIQMIDAAEDKHLWAETYDREIQDIFAVQSDIAGRVAASLKVELLSPEKKEITQVPTRDVDAHALYLKGIFHVDKGSPTDVEKALRYFELASEQDPDFALAHAMVATCYIGIADETLPALVAFPKAKAAVAKALAIDDRLPEAQNALGLIAYQYDWDWEEAEKRFKEAIALNPSLIEGYTWYARFLSSMGRFEEALSIMGRGYELDPLSPFTTVRFGLIHWMAGDDRKARELWKKTLESHPNFARAYSGLALLDAMAGNKTDAIKNADAMIRISNEAFFRTFQCWVYALLDEEEKTREIQAGLLSGKYQGYASPVHIASNFYLLGEKELGCEWMQKAYEVRSASLPILNNWPTLNKAREDPRYLEILRKMKLP
jgi:adenylate cyclase